MNAFSQIVLLSFVFTGDPWIAYWDHSGFTGFDELGRPAELVAVEYVAADIPPEIETLTAPSVVFNRITEDLRLDWVAALQAAGVAQELIDSFQNNYRADLITGLVQTLDPGRYSLWARVQNSQGRWSLWTRSQDVIGIVARPDAPQNLRCEGCP